MIAPATEKKRKKRPRGRPRKRASERYRSPAIMTRIVGDEEWQKFCAAREVAGETISEFARAAVAERCGRILADLEAREN